MTRKEGEQISVNNGEILIEIVEIHGKTAKLCFQASKEISIKRVEESACKADSSSIQR